MPKKQQRNALYYYMKELQQEMREGGKTLPMKEIAEIACPKYKELSSEDKYQYEKMANAYKAQRKGEHLDKLTSLGESISAIQAEEKEAKRRDRVEIARVQNFVSRNISSIADVSIYVVSFNIMVATRENEFLPNEVGIVEYSLRQGIKSSYHTFINPGRVPVGYFSAAKSHSEEFHKIPVIMEEFTGGNVENDYATILENIASFTQSKLSPIILFTHISQMEQNEEAFRWLKEQAPDEDIGDISFANISLLLVNLFSVTDNDLPCRVAADDMLNQNTFDYVPNSRCPYHEDLDSRYCTLSFARKMCFILSDSLVKLYGLELTASHLPTRENSLIAIEPLVKMSIGPDVSYLPDTKSQSYAAEEERKLIEPLIDLDDYEDYEDFSLNELVGATAAPEKEVLRIPEEVLLPSYRHHTSIKIGRGRGILFTKNI